MVCILVSDHMSLQNDWIVAIMQIMSGLRVKGHALVLSFSLVNNDLMITGNVGRDILLSLEESDQDFVNLNTNGGVASLTLVQTLDREKLGSSGFSVSLQSLFFIYQSLC